MTSPVVKESLNLSTVNLAKKNHIQKIVIDAGHGGKDRGCSGAISKEKELTLAIALKLGRQINRYHPELEIIYTRETDVFIPLFKRIDMANKSDADLFISIHCNAVGHKNTRGTETYVMGLHTAEENLYVAKRENASILYEEDFQATYDGYDPQSPEGHIILSMFQNVHLEQSIGLANRIEASFNKRTPLSSRGVKQAGFVVLRQATMPSVLIETGFLTNNKEEEYLLSERGQDEITLAIALAFTEYLQDLAAKEAYASLEENGNENENISGNENENINQNENMNAEEERRSRSTEGSSGKNENENISGNGNENISGNENGNVNENINENENKKAEMEKMPRSTEESGGKNGNSAEPETREGGDQSIENQIIYKVQVAASRNKPIPRNNPDLFDISDLVIKQEDNLFKYLTGHFTSLEQAAEERNRMRAKGFKGAFIVGYKGEERIKL